MGLAVIPEVQRLLDLAADAMDRSEWASACELADKVLSLDETNEVASAIRQVARFRIRRREASQDIYGRRNLTVLFCDLVGSTELASTMDPEVIRDMLLEYQRICTRVVRTFDGFVARFIGDGLLAYFGFPRAHEDDAERAVLAALGIVDELDRRGRAPDGAAQAGGLDQAGGLEQAGGLDKAGGLEQAGGLDRPVPLSVRIGIHTGLTVLAQMGSGERIEQFDVVGEVPGLASRIQALAGANHVLVSDDTYRIVKGRFDARDLGVHDVKGISRPVGVLEIIGEKPLASRFAAQGARLAPLVDREGQQLAIREAWCSAREGLATLVLRGDPGIGKSRLVEFAREVADADHAPTIVLQCLALETSSALHPFARHIRRASGVELGGSAAVSAWATAEGLPGDATPLLLSLLAVPLRDGTDPPTGSPEQIRERTFDLLTSWVDRLGGDVPCLLVVEDIQWADASTFELVSRLVERGPHAKVLLLMTSRRESQHIPAGAPVHELGPLSAADCWQIIDQVRDHAIPSQLRRAIVERCDGVPLYVEELTRMLSGRTATSASGESQAVTIPPTLNELLMTRLDQLPSHLGVLQAVASCAQPVSVGLLSDVLDADAAQVVHQLEFLLSAGLLQRSGSGSDVTYNFAHVLVRDAAYELQLLSRRRQMHARIASVLEKHLTGIGIDQPNVLAFHLERSDQWEEAVDHWCRSGRRQAGLGAHREAISDFRRALALIGEHPGAVEGALELDGTLGLANSLLATEGYVSTQVAEEYQRLRQLSEIRGSDRHAIPTLFGLWAFYYVKGDNEMALPLAQQLVAAASRSTPEDKVAADSVLGYQFMAIGDFEAARQLLEPASQASLGRGGPMPQDATVGAGVNLAPVLWAMGDLAGARRCAEAAVERAEQLTNQQAPFSRAYAYAWAAEFCNLAEDFAGAAGYAARAIGVATEFGFATWVGAGMLQMSVARANSESGDEPIATLRMMVAAWDQAGARSNWSQFMLGLALGLRRRGLRDEALAAIDDGLENAARTKERVLDAELHRVRGELLAEAGDHQAATRDLTTAVDIARSQGARLYELRALTSLFSPVGYGPDAVGGPEWSAWNDRLQELLATFSDTEHPVVLAARAAAAGATESQSAGSPGGVR